MQMDGIKKIIDEMTLEDKVALCSGASFWETKKYEKYGIPSIFMCDGPHGLRKQDTGEGADMLGVNKSRPATCFPAEVTTAGSWDDELLQEIGNAIGQEALSQKVGLVLGPGANLKRNPLCGRNFEYFSEDPYLAGKLAAGFIRGVEDQGVGTSLKHFAANSQETCRFTSDSVMDDRTLRELYLTAFEIAVKEGKPSTVMCSYPKLNGIHCSDHKELLTDILRTDWGFDGMVVTDWGAMNNRLEGFRAGCDLNMPGGSDFMEKAVVKAVREGTLSEENVDASATRVLQLVFQVTETLNNCNVQENWQETHHALARKAAEQGAVLLKNKDDILPLRANAKIVVVGHMAKELRYQGAGSSHINPTKISQPLDYIQGASYAPGCDERGDTTNDMLKQAAKKAKEAEIAVVFAGLPGRYESEGFDREDMKMPQGHIRMIEAVAEANPNTVVVLLCGCVVECPWADKVKGILYMGLPGQAGGEAIANLLYGNANPSGKLAESWPFRNDDCVSSPYYGKTRDALYQEGIYVGYRYYDKAQKKVRWPFGYGLSYTQFVYSDIEVSDSQVKVLVTNVGDRDGAETVQMYIEAPRDGIHRPVRELKGYKKVFLQAGESREVSLPLCDRSFAIWQDGWKVPKGEYAVVVGGSSADISLRQTIYKEGVEMPTPEWQKDSWYATFAGIPQQEDLELAMGRAYKPQILKKRQYTMDNTVMEMKEDSLLMKIMYKAVEKVVAKGNGGKVDYENPEFRMLMASSVGSPLRSMQISSGMKGGIFEGLLEIANGHFFRGIKTMITGK
ncbi:MAG: beta-glucosidase [Lachnospiraceae bacterium]|nr:beta-glucosidase [Lachnospiraceae bacterium]